MVSLGHLDQPVRWDLLDLMVLLVQQDHKGPQGLPVLEGLLVQQDHKGPQGLPVFP